jgi:aldehyde dehydrogenase (NAD+)
VFGPVLAITPFRTEAEAVEIANSTPYGLSAYIQTTDLRRAHRVADELVTGEVLVNGAVNLGVHRPFDAIAFLVSDRAKWITWVSLPVDAGFSVR